MTLNDLPNDTQFERHSQDSGVKVHDRAEESATVLFITSSTPFSQKSGTEQRSSLIYGALQRIGRVDVVLLTEGAKLAPLRSQTDSGESLVTLQVQKNARVFDRFHPQPGLTKTIEAELGRRLDTYRLIVGRYLWPISQLEIPGRTQTIVDLDDFKYRYAPEVRWSIGLLKERATKYLSHHLAKRALRRFDAAFLVCELDASATRHMKTQALPNIPMTIRNNPTLPPLGKNLLFVGSLWYRPNADGVNWFLNHVWPHILLVEPNASIVLAGPAPESVRNQWESHPNVKAPGFVPSLDDLYGAASVVVIPIHSGGGSNIKVLECLGHQRICVATQFTINAFGSTLQAGKHILSARNAQDFAEQVLRVLERPADYWELAQQGYDLVCRRFSSSAFAATASGFAQRVLDAEPLARD